MAHRGEDLTAQPIITGEPGHGQRLHKVPLSHALLFQVVRLPTCELRDLGGR
jgi:hypothetical protein